MKHITGTNFCLVILIITLCATQSWALNNDDTIMVTATKTAKEIDSVAASIVVITQEEIDLTGAADLKGIFESTPGLTLQYGTFPAASAKSKSSVSIRGLGANGTLFLLDGRRLAGEVKNPYDMDRIPAAMIERIEIIKGPMSVLYGADAMGGVINIITKKSYEKLAGTVSVQGGTNDQGDGSQLNAGLSLRGQVGRARYSFYANALNTDPYEESERTTTRIKTPMGLVPPSMHPHPQIKQIKDSYLVDVSYREESEVFTVGGRFSYDLLKSTTLGVEFNYFTEERDGTYRSPFFPTAISPAPKMRIAAFDTPTTSHDDNERLDLGMDLSSQVSDNLTLNFRVYNSYYEKRNTTTAANWLDAGYASESGSESLGMNANVDIWSYEGYGVYALGAHHLITAGGEYRDEEREGTVFNQAGTMESRSVDYTAGYIQDEWQLTDTLNATIGARYDAISNADNRSTFKLGLVNKFNPSFILRGNFAQGYRTPDIRELYISKNTPGGSQRGASVSDAMLGKAAFDLDPEFVNSYEIGISGQRQGFHYSAAIFYNKIDDKISQVTKNPGTATTYYTFKNISEVVTYGLELSTGYEFNSGLGVQLDWYELETENKENNDDLEFNPKRHVTVTINYHGDNFNAWVAGRHIGKQYAVEADNEWIDSYFLVDIGANYSFGSNKTFELFGGVKNLLDEEVDTLIGSNIGPYFHAGLRYNF